MIDFSLTDENRLVRESVRGFVAAEILPNIRAWDEQGAAHPEVFAKMGELGYLGAPIPEAWGGAGMDYVSLAILCEELERADVRGRDDTPWLLERIVEATAGRSLVANIALVKNNAALAAPIAGALADK